MKDIFHQMEAATVVLFPSHQFINCVGKYENKMDKAVLQCSTVFVSVICVCQRLRMRVQYVRPLHLWSWRKCVFIKHHTAATRTAHRYAVISECHKLA